MRVFLSYSQRSRVRAVTLGRDLRVLGHDVWIDEVLTGGQDWWDQILLNIRECDVFTVVLDQHFTQSEACRRELHYATSLHKHVLPVLVSAHLAAWRVPDPLVGLQHVKYHHRTVDTALHLARALSDMPHRDLANPLPPPPPRPMPQESTPIDAEVPMAQVLQGLGKTEVDARRASLLGLAVFEVGTIVFLLPLFVRGTSLLVVVPAQFIAVLWYFPSRWLGMSRRRWAAALGGTVVASTGFAALAAGEGPSPTQARLLVWLGFSPWVFCAACALTHFGSKLLAWGDEWWRSIVEPTSTGAIHEPVDDPQAAQRQDS